MPSLPPILFEDDAIIAFDKPSGLLVAPDRWDKDRENLMKSVHEVLSPGIFNVHRLDADTSGVLLCAKTKAALDRLCGQFQSRDVAKQYLAITRGAPREDQGTVQKSIVPDLQRPGRMRVASHGKPAETQFEVVERWSRGAQGRRTYALLKCVPLTGRTHQIRVHLAYLGCPIVADTFYGDGGGLLLSELKKKYKQKKDEPERPLVGRLALHAERLTLRHPVSGDPLTIVAPLPKDFEIALKYLRKFG